MSARKQCGKPAGAGSCTRPAGHGGKHRHISARVVRGPQLSLAAVGAVPAPRWLPDTKPEPVGAKRARVVHTSQARAIRAELRERLVPNGIYRQQFAKCGRSTCGKCFGKHAKPSHGPYWYVEWIEGTRRKTRYVGKSLPPAIAAHVAQFGKSEARAAAQEQLAGESES